MLELFVQSLSEKKLDVLFFNLEQLGVNPFSMRYPNRQMMIISFKLALPSFGGSCPLKLTLRHMSLVFGDPVQLYSELHMLIFCFLIVDSLTHF
jgi:hypothetical protein